MKRNFATVQRYNHLEQGWGTLGPNAVRVNI